MANHCFSIASLRVWQFSSKHRWLPVLMLVLTFVVMIGTLGGCYAIAKHNGDLPSNGGYPPAISMLGDKMPEHALFAVGFFLLVLTIAFCIFFRAGQLDQIRPRSAFTIVSLFIGLFALPWIVVMALIPTSSALGSLHLAAAAVGMGFISVYGLYTSVLSIIWSCGSERSPDRNVPASVRYICYVFSASTSIIGPILFGIWMTDVTRTPFEWAGVSMVFVAFIPFFVLFGMHSPASPELEGLLDARQ